MNVVPIVVPQINWHEFVCTSKASLGRSPTRSLDGAGVAPGSLPTFIQAVGEFQNPNTNVISYLRGDACLDALKLISITFLIEAPKDQIYAILKIGHMSIVQAHSQSMTEEMLLASTTVNEWQSIVQRGTHIPVVLEIAKWLIRLDLRDLLASCDFPSTRSIENKHNA